MTFHPDAIKLLLKSNRTHTTERRAYSKCNQISYYAQFVKYVKSEFIMQMA